MIGIPETKANYNRIVDEISVRMDELDIKDEKRDLILEVVKRRSKLLIQAAFKDISNNTLLHSSVDLDFHLD